MRDESTLEDLLLEEHKIVQNYFKKDRNPILMMRIMEMRKNNKFLRWSTSHCKVTTWKKKRKVNALPNSFGVIYISLIMMLAHVWVKRHILDQIQNKITNKSYSHSCSHTGKKNTRPHCLGVKQKIWWRSRTP